MSVSGLLDIDVDMRVYSREFYDFAHEVSRCEEEDNTTRIAEHVRRACGDPASLNWATLAAYCSASCRELHKPGVHALISSADCSRGKNVSVHDICKSPHEGYQHCDHSDCPVVEVSAQRMLGRYRAIPKIFKFKFK